MSTWPHVNTQMVGRILELYDANPRLFDYLLDDVFLLGTENQSHCSMFKNGCSLYP